MDFKVLLDDLSDGAIIKLLNSHMHEMHKYSPPESIHALNPQELKDSSVTFWGVRVDGELVGCGALKQLSKTEGELKSMKTANSFLRKGIASMLLEAIVEESINRSYSKVNLETGSHKAFQPAIELYKKYGFVESGPFAEYKLDPYSKFFTKEL